MASAAAPVTAAAASAGSADKSKPLSLWEKFGYGSGDFAANLYIQMFGFFLLFYYTDVYGISPGAVATLMLLSKVLDAVSDPAMGLIADRTRSRWGRYRPYLLWGAIPLGISGFLVFAGPELSNTGKVIWAGVTFILVRQVFTLVNIPYSGLLGVIHPSSAERTKATTWRFSMSTCAAIFIGLTGTALIRELGGGDYQTGIRWTMAVMAVLATVLTLLAFATTRERVEPRVQQRSVKADIRAVVSTRWWVVCALASILLMTGLVTRFGTALYFFKYILAAPEEPVLGPLDLPSLFLASGAFAQLIGVIAGGLLAARFSKGRLVLWAAVVQVLAMLGFEFVGRTDYAAMMVLQAFASAGYGVCITMLFAMFTDLAEFIEWRSKLQVTALVISASIFGLKVGNALAVAIPGYVLEFTGFVANQEQTQAAQDGIMLVFQWLPIVCVAGVAALMLAYGLDKTRVRQVEAELNERRAAAQ